MLGHDLPIWAVVLVEFVLAYTLEVTVGSPFSFKIASRIFDMKTTHPFIFETAIICATVTIMCPAMSFLTAFLYYPFKAIPHNHRRIPLHAIHLQIFRHITQIYLEIR